MASVKKISVKKSSTRKAPRAVPPGAPEVHQLVENAPVIVPSPRYAKTRSAGVKSKPTFMGFRRENGRKTKFSQYPNLLLNMHKKA